MGYFANVVGRAGRLTTGIGVGFLTGIMVLTVANIVYRLFGRVIIGTYELTQYMIVVTIGFALVYTGLRQSHVVVSIVVSRFSKRARAIAESFHSVIGTIIWALIAWVTIRYLLEKGFAGEGVTELLKIPYLPLKCVWAFALILCSVVFLIDFSKALSKALVK